MSRSSSKSSSAAFGLTEPPPPSVMPRHRVSPSASPMTGSGGASSNSNCQWSLSDFSEYWIARSSRAMTSEGRFDPIGIRSTNRFLLAGSLLVILGIAGGCSAIDRISQIGEQPKLAAIENPTSQPGYKPVQMPMPKPEVASYNANSLWRNGSRAFFKDQRAARIGDILTVTVNFTDKADINNETKRDRTSKEDSGITDFIAAGTIGAQGRKILPGKLLVTDSTSKYDGSGSVVRTENLRTNVAAVVTQLLPNGNLVVEGKQEIRVNFEIRELIVAGIVRPEDIQSDNTIDSSKIAQARIAYGGRGQITDFQQPRYGQQVTDILLPF
jgi:flagellar L-ring protein precursor FlgH